MHRCESSPARAGAPPVDGKLAGQEELRCRGVLGARGRSQARPAHKNITNREARGVDAAAVNTVGAELVRGRQVGSRLCSVGPKPSRCGGTGRFRVAKRRRYGARRKCPKWCGLSPPHRSRRPLEEPLGKSQPTISHHTGILAEAGLLAGERRGRWVWWSIVPDRLASLRRVFEGKEP